MTSKNDYVYYAPLPHDPSAQQNVVVLPLYYPRPRPKQRRLRKFIGWSTSLLLLLVSVFFLFPSDPTIEVVRVHLNHVRVNSSPLLTLDLSFSLTVKVHNRDFFSLDYDSLIVSLGYRGRQLGFVSSDGGHVRARASSYVNATLDLNGFEVIHDVFYLLQDLARGEIPFDTNTEVKGVLGLFSLKIPLKGRVGCEVYVNTDNQTIVHEYCHPE